MTSEKKTAFKAALRRLTELKMARRPVSRAAICGRLALLEAAIDAGEAYQRQIRVTGKATAPVGRTLSRLRRSRAALGAVRAVEVLQAQRPAPPY